MRIGVSNGWSRYTTGLNQNCIVRLWSPVGNQEQMYKNPPKFCTDTKCTVNAVIPGDKEYFLSGGGGDVN